MMILKLARLLLAAIVAASYLVYAIDTDGEWGEGPFTTFTIPNVNPANGLYLKNIQASYPDVDWNNLDRLYIPAGQYRLLKIGGLPDRTPENPLIISNSGGQVRVGGLDFYYLVSIEGGSNWIFTGKYDPVSKTGHEDYPGHRGGNYANTGGTYGILVDDDYRPGGNSGIAVGDRNSPTTDFTISFVEIREVAFAGMLIKADNKDNQGPFTMNNVYLHDNYIHDVGSEGMYVGSTNNGREQHSFENLKISNNRILRTGTEGLQAGQLGSGCEIHNNVIALSAIAWKDAFQTYQDMSVQITHRYGNTSVYNNIFIGAGGNLLSFTALNGKDDPHNDGDTLSVHNNFFSSSRGLGAYMGQKDQPSTSNVVSDGVTTYSIKGNSFRQLEYQRDELFSNASPNSELIRFFHKFQNKVELEGNVLDSPGLDHLILARSNPWICGALDPNGESCNVTGTDNLKQAVDPVTFVDFLPSIPADVDYLLVEQWASTTATWAGSQPIAYQEGDYAIYRSMVYRATAPNTGVQPGSDDDLAGGVWESLPAPVDDVRLACDSAHEGIGLLDTLDCPTPTDAPTDAPTVVACVCPEPEALAGCVDDTDWHFRDRIYERSCAWLGGQNWTNNEKQVWCNETANSADSDTTKVYEYCKATCDSVGHPNACPSSIYV